MPPARPMAVCVSQYSSHDRIGDDCCQSPASYSTCASGPSYGCLCVAVQQPRPYRRRPLQAAGLAVNMCLRPVLWLSTNAVHFVIFPRRSLFCSSFAFLFSFRQTFPILVRSSFPLFRLFRSCLFLFSVLLSARHFLDGGVFRSIGNC